MSLKCALRSHKTNANQYHYTQIFVQRPAWLCYFYGIKCLPRPVRKSLPVHLGVNMSMISAAGVRPTWLVHIMGVIQPQWTRVSLWCHPFTHSGQALSAEKSLSRMAHEMLRCAQHDRTALGMKVISKECLSPKDLKKRKTTGGYGAPRPWRLARTDREKLKNWY
jgi:hypothetical protein